MLDYACCSSQTVATALRREQARHHTSPGCSLWADSIAFSTWIAAIVWSQPRSFVARRLENEANSALEPFLAAEPGLDSGVMMLEYTARAAAADARTLAMPMAVPSAWASLGSHASIVARTA